MRGRRLCFLNAQCSALVRAGDADFVQLQNYRAHILTTDVLRVDEKQDNIMYEKKNNFIAPIERACAHHLRAYASVMHYSTRCKFVYVRVCILK